MHALLDIFMVYLSFYIQNMYMALSSVKHATFYCRNFYFFIGHDVKDRKQ